MDHRDLRKFDIWREQLWSTYVRLESTSDDPCFFGHVREMKAGCNMLTQVHSTKQMTERMPSHLKSDPQEVVLMAVQTTGYGFVEQDGRQARLERGDFAIYETVRPYKLYMEKPFDQLILKLPRNMLERRLPDLSHQTARRFNGQSGAVSIAAGFVLQLAENAEKLGEKGPEGFAASAADLIANAIEFETADVNSTDKVRFERLQKRILSHIRSSIPDLSELAAIEGMSLRTLNRLFQIHGTTPSKWIMEQRLEGAIEDLMSPALQNRSVTEIAFSWGFNDLSYFNRVFRAKCGVSPRMMRAK